MQSPIPADLAAMEVLPLNSAGLFQCDFVYRDIHFAARYEGKDESGHMRLAGDVGPMPFSAESPAARAGLARIIVRANDHLGPVFRLVHGRVTMGGGRDLAGPVTPSDLMAAVAAILIPAVPYLDLMAMYVRPPLAPTKAGESAVRPEWRRRVAART